jgi:hypothetical protein
MPIANGLDEKRRQLLDLVGDPGVPSEEGNERAFLEHYLRMIALQKSDALIQLHNEISGLIGQEAIDLQAANLRESDGIPRFELMVTQMGELGPVTARLISAQSFDDALVQYQKCNEHALKCWQQAATNFLSGNPHFASFFSILTLEEVGKLSLSWFALVAHLAGKPSTRGKLGATYKSHPKKQFISVIKGALSLPDSLRG